MYIPVCVYGLVCVDGCIYWVDLEKRFEGGAPVTADRLRGGGTIRTNNHCFSASAPRCVDHSVLQCCTQPSRPVCRLPSLTKGLSIPCSESGYASDVRDLATARRSIEGQKVSLGHRSGCIER